MNRDEGDIINLYQALLDSWNQQNASDYAALFDEESFVVGFDGSMMYGAEEIERTLGGIFADHPTATYVAKVRKVRFLGDEVAVLHAVVGMVPRGQTELNPAANSIQTVVATKQEGRWCIASFQNTPAQFHGRPEVSEALTKELRELL